MYLILLKQLKVILVILIECDGSAYLFFCRGCSCGQKGEWDLASCSLFLKDCEIVKIVLI